MGPHTTELQQMLEEANSGPIAEADILWFWSYKTALDMADYSTREMAEMLQDGVPAMSLETVEEELEAIAEEDDTDSMDWIRNIAAEFYG